MPLHSRLQTLFKTIFYMPGVTSAVVIGLVWLWIFYPFAEGLANFAVTSLGLPKQNWLGNCANGTAVDHRDGVDDRPGRHDRPVHGGPRATSRRSLYEAADIDCARGWARFRRVTWPLIKPTTLYAAITATAGSFLVFDLVYTLTKGGPGNATTTVAYRIWQIAFERLDFGLASAGAVLLGLLVILLQRHPVPLPVDATSSTSGWPTSPSV